MNRMQPPPQADEEAPPVSPSRPSFLQNVRSFLILWVRLNALDVIVLLGLWAVTLAAYWSPPAPVRTFPVTFDNSGDIVYPDWAYPHRGWVLPSWLSGLFSIAGPMLVYMLSQFRIKSVWDANNAIMGTTWALSLATTFQVALKHFIGGFRPYFLDACAPDVSLARTNNKTGLNGVGFQQVMFTTEICTQTNELLMKDAVTSFPSGHTAGAFAGFVFLSLWLNAKLKAWSNHKPAFWKLALTILPMLAATMIACSLTIDAAHNWYDIVAGAIIGITMAVASYRATYAAVLDWRFNHVPLREDKPFSYGVEMEGGPVSSAMEYTFTRSAGWGASRDLPT